MPQKSSFFDSAPGDERYYPAREFAEYFSRFIGNGIFSGGTVLKVSATGTDANVSIALGHAWINGYKYSVYDQALSLPVSPATTQDRIDRIILRLDISTPIRTIQALVLQGVPGSAPVAPAIVRSGSIYDLSLAQVLVKANTSVVKPENITDERLNNTVCGIVTGLIQQADTTQIFNEFQAWMNTKKAEFQSQWNQFMSSIIDEGFATKEYVDSAVAAVPQPPSASTTVKGITQLSDATNNTSTSLAATANAVKKAFDRAEQAFQSANDGKNAIASAVSGKGVPATGSDTFAILANKITQINTGRRFVQGMYSYNGGAFVIPLTSFLVKTALFWKGTGAGNTSGTAIAMGRITDGLNTGVLFSKDATGVSSGVLHNQNSPNAPGSVSIINNGGFTYGDWNYLFFE